MRRVRLSPLAAAAAALLAFSCSHAPPPATGGSPSSSAPPSGGENPGGQTAPGSIPGQTPGLPPEAPPPPSGPPPTSPVSDYHEVIKLNQANLSEDFILATIRNEGRAYSLDADEVIALRNAGVSERVIQAMLDSGKGLVTGAGRRVPEDRLTVAAGAPPPEPAGEVAPARAPVWEGLARRQDGVVLFKDRWHVGTLTLAEGQLRWMDAKDSTRNLLVPVNAIVEQFRTCLKRPGGNECFEWGFRTKSGDTYRFRDVAWEQGEDRRALDVHAFLQSRYPDLVDSDRAVDEKEK